MLKHFEGAKLGLFIFIGTVLIVLSIFLIGNKDSLFIDSYTVKAYFEDVAGLRTGASVRLSGMEIGSVSDVSLIPDTTGRVEVDMRIQKDLIQFIRLDSEASIETEGLVGGKIVSISVGSRDMEVVEDEGIIKAKSPLNLSKVIEETQGIISYLRLVTRDLSEIVGKVNAGQGTIGKIVNDEELYFSAVDVTKATEKSLVQMTGKLGEITDFITEMGTGVQSIISNLDTSFVAIKNLVDDVESGKGVLGALINDRGPYDSLQTVINNLIITTESVTKGTESFNENMEALKHNWLFKNYFEERGYWSTAEFENKMDSKIDSIKKQSDLLEKRLDELKIYQDKINQLKEK